MSATHHQKIIGRVEPIGFPGQQLEAVYARIDTGARTSSIWVSAAEPTEDGQLRVIFFGAGSPHYTGKEYYFTDFDITAVASSNGQVQERYKIRLSIKIGGRRIRARFTLADRSEQVYPVLIGRNVLRGKFIVDVTQGAAQREIEAARSAELQARLHATKGGQQ